MNKIKSAFLKLGSQLILSVQRFPETIFVAICTVIVAIMTNHNLKVQNDLESLLMVLFIGLPLFAAFKLIVERKLISIKWRIGVDLIFVALLTGFYFLIPDPIGQHFMLNYMISVVLFFLVFLIIPYFYRRKNFSTYCVKLASSFFVTYLYTLVLYLGTIAIIFTIDQLFSLDMKSEIYMDLLFIAVGIFGVTYFLGKLPRLEDDVAIETFPIVFKVLIVSILMPLITAYTLVLYAYFAKILIIWSWPKGLVGQLVVWYGLISMMIIFSLQDLGENNSWIKTFKRFFPICFLLPLIMMFTAIGIRISQNGWTLPRYYVVLVGIWLFIMAGYYILKKHNQSTFAITLAIILLFISICGPLNGYSTSFRSQNQRLETLLKENNMLEGVDIVAREDLSVEKKAKISNIVYYLDSIESLEHTSYLPTGFNMSQMKEVFGFESEYGYYPVNDAEKPFGYYYNPMNLISPVAGYNYMIDFAVYENNPLEIVNPAIVFKASIETDQLELTFNKKTLALQSIQDIAKTLYGKLGTKQDIHEGDLTYIIENDKAIVLLNISNLYGNISGDEFKVNSMEGTAWVTIK